jgi:hypothetical protein
MPKSILRQGAASAALILALGDSPVLAQEALPTIEIGSKPTATGRSQTGAGQVVSAPTQESSTSEPQPTLKPEPTVTSATTREFTGAEVNAIPFAQPSEALQIVPGLVVESHTGVGKAFHYYMRGFDLDHGNDLSLTLDGMPLNMPTHAHGQGYADANFLIPELFSTVEVRKGPFFADEGVFASAGAVHMQYIDKLREGLLSASGGSFAWGRLLGAKSWAVGDGELLAAIEGNIYNGPWERPDEARKINGVVRWSQGTQENGLSLTAMAYSNHWFGTEQIPQHLVDEGFLSRWGTTDPTDGGNAARYSLSARWSQQEKDYWSRVEAFIIRSDFNLYTNTTLFQENQTLGDQFHQFDRRTVYGFNALHGFDYAFANFPVETRFGVQGRYDDIRLGLNDSFERQSYDAVRDDYVKEGSIAFWTDTTVRWTPWFRTTVGARFDYFHVAVNSVQNPYFLPIAFDGGVPGYTGVLGLPAWAGIYNSGTRDMTMGSPKAGMVLGPFNKTEFYFNFGEGAQSTDARGTVINLNPLDGTPFGDMGMIQQVPLLVKTRGAEVGMRTRALLDGLDTGLALYWQDFDSENLFEGDSGTTVFGRPSRRYGFELTNHYSPYSWLRLDGVVAMTHSRFRGYDYPQAAAYYILLNGGDPLFPLGTVGNSPGNYLTLAPGIIATAGIEVGEKTGWFGGLWFRYFGSRPLTEDGYFQSHPSSVFNGRLGYRFDNGWKIQLDGFNIFNCRCEALSFAYGSFPRSDLLLQPVTASIMDRHFRPQNPPAVRLTLSGPLSVFEPPLMAPVASAY